MTETTLPPLPPEIVALSFEEAMAQLEGIVKKLESGQGQLDDAISAYERGTLLRRHCDAKLKEAESRIDRITKAADGSLTTQTVETI